MKNTTIEELSKKLTGLRTKKENNYLEIKSDGYSETMFQVQSIINVVMECLINIENERPKEVSLIDVCRVLELTNNIIENFNEDFEILDEIKEYDSTR